MWAVVNSKSSSWNVVERLCFPAPNSSYTIKSFPEELILIPREDGEKVPCLFLPFRHARFLFIYFHANAEDLGLCYTFCTIIRDLFQVHMLAVEYPGYGICPGHTDEAGIMLNATAAVRFALDTLNWPCDGIKLFGRSIGTGPAMALASQYAMAGLILVTPFLSIRRIFQAQVGPLAGLIADRFDNSELASKIESPTLIIHGQQDTLIPLAHSKIIYDALPSKKMMVCPAVMGHNTSLLANVGTFVLPMTQFFSLPDYTFEDIEVPAWAFPDITGEDENSRIEMDEDQWVCATTHWLPGAAPSPRVNSEWRRNGGNPGGAGMGASVGFPTPSPLQQPVCADQQQKSSATTSSSASSGQLDAAIEASRGYGFQSPPMSPRGPQATVADLPKGRTAGNRAHQPPSLPGDPHVVEDCFLEPPAPEEETLGSKVDANENISKDMENAINSGITWLVDTGVDHDKVGKDSASENENVAGPGALRGAPELRERMAERLRESEPEPEDALAPSTVPVESGAGAPNGSDSTTDPAAQTEASRDDSDSQRYCL